MSIHAAPDPADRTEPLPAATLRTLAAIDDRAAAAFRDAAPEFAATQEWAIAAHQKLGSLKQQTRDALSDATLYERDAGALLETPSRAHKLATTGALGVITAGETALGYAGVKAALGNFGDGNLLSDPLALLAAFGFGAGSALLAGVAGRQLAAAERSVLGEPERGEVHETAKLPLSVTDPEGPGVLPPSLVDGVREPRALKAVPAHEVDPARHAQLFRDGRSRAVRLALGGVAVALGIGLWTINGILRAEFREMSLPAPTASGTSLSSIATPALTASAGGTMEGVLIALGIVLFCSMVAIVAATHTALGLRADVLQRRAKRKLRELHKAIRRCEKAIRAHEKIRGRVDYERAHAANLHTTVRADSEGRA